MNEGTLKDGRTAACLVAQLVVMLLDELVV